MNNINNICPYCKDWFAKPGSLNTHIVRCHPGKYYIPYRKTGEKLDPRLVSKKKDRKKITDRLNTGDLC